jgi:hypothetical protein
MLTGFNADEVDRDRRRGIVRGVEGDPAPDASLGL